MLKWRKLYNKVFNPKGPLEIHQVKLSVSLFSFFHTIHYDHVFLLSNSSQSSSPFNPPSLRSSLPPYPLFPRVHFMLTNHSRERGLP